ncbi:helix-turn-helix domain-containing protein [Holdemanella porci]|uniref:helix-turn-helix domain-containing protein n=1 Tax=Holdemanella porci TaxID=2652276 RepID=UPI003F9221A2
MMRGDDMANKMNVELDTVLANELKDARTHKQLSQDEIANLVGISRQKYQRIEKCIMDTVDDNLLRKLAEVLELDYFTLVNNRNMYRLTVNITKEKRNDLMHLKDDKGFSSISETIKYCIEYTLNDISKSNVSTEIMNDVREAIVNTFIQEMNKLTHAHDMDTLILKYLDDKYGTNSNELRTDIEQYLANIKHSSKY